MKKIQKGAIRMVTAITATAALFGVLWNAGDIKIREVKAATQKETVDLRIIGTTDLHGQLNSIDYEQGVDYSNGGLARLSDLIKTTKSEVPTESIITVDAGDTLFDNTTEYIFAENPEEIQPIYKAMAQIGYDAITLGNHDFDYGYDYILRQLNASGLRDITVVSNVTDSKTGEYPFLENMLITRTLTTSAGNKVEVQIGIIGQTIPTLTSKTHSYTGILKAEDMVTNAKAQAIKLKEMGADVIIALSHTGIGPENPEPSFKNVAYALTKINEIDVVVCGHEHKLFPTTDMTSPYYSLPNVDKKTYLMNGKNVIMAGNRGSAVGVVDLTLTVYKDSNRISDRSSEIRLVTKQNTTENKDIANSYGAWEEKLLSYSTEIIAKLGKDEVIQNFFGMLGDNAAIQLLNDSKIDYAQRFVQTTGTKYLNYPIIAASTYMAYGESSINDYINIHDDITESDLSAIQPYNSYLYIYTITGKQLKEWLEWSASAYETTINGSKWSSGTMSDLVKQTGIKSLIREDWLNDWSNFYVFDGIHYVIDPFNEPRYDLSGNMISNSTRVSNIKYNGKSVTEDMVLLIATNKITQPSIANKGVEKQVALNGFNRTQVILSKYIQEISADNSIMPKLDYNWRVTMPKDNSFIVKLPNYAASLFEKTVWYKNYLTEIGEYRYYTASYPVENGDTVGPHIVATPVNTSATASPYKVMVHASDRSELKVVCYLDGDYDVDSKNLANGSKLATDHTFTVSENGIYTIYAEDQAGNKTLYKLVIDNFSDNLLSSPTINTYTNRKTKITGRGEPNTTIVFEAYTGTFESKVSKSGTFSYALPSQPSGTVVSVYLKDETKRLESARVAVKVKRTGPNLPSINLISNTNGFITGDLDDEDASLIAIVGDTVYVPKNGGKELYEMNTEIYNPSLNVEEVDFDRDDLGYCIMLIPPQEAGATMTFYNLDHLSRNSRQFITKVIEAGPNAPYVYEISNIENTMNGYVPANDNNIYDITITLGKKTYNTRADKSGLFSYQFEEQLHAGEIIMVTASDRKYSSIRYSYTTEVVVKDIEEYIRTNSTSLTLNRVTDKSYMISATYQEKGLVYLAIASGTGENFESTLHMIETDDFGGVKLKLDGKLEVGCTIYAMVRFEDGKILTASKTEVIGGRPDMPVLLKVVTNSDKMVQVNAKKDCEVTLKIGSSSYVSTTYEFDAAKDQYIYSFVTARAVSGTTVKATATNTVGTSDALITTVVKAAPDRPQVNEIKSGVTKITGKVELFEYVAPVVEESTEQTTEATNDITTEEAMKSVETTKPEEEVPKRFKDAPAKVAQTQTRIFAQIGKKVYEGTITDKGKFAIEIPAQEVGSEVSVWGMNKSGRGPLIKVIVVK